LTVINVSVTNGANKAAGRCDERTGEIDGHEKVRMR